MITREDWEKSDEGACGKKIIIVEGPAGAGKSSLITRLVDISPTIGTVQRSLGKRSFRALEAVYKSSVNDIRKLQMALFYPYPIEIIDRCMASQKVYHHLRTGEPITATYGIHSYTAQLLSVLERDLAWRTNREEQEIELIWLFLIPSIEALERHRETGGKEYPNSASDEVLAYRDVSNALLDGGANVLRPQYNTVKDQDFIVESFERWITYYPHLNFGNLWRAFAGHYIVSRENQNHWTDSGCYIDPMELR